MTGKAKVFVGLVVVLMLVVGFITVSFLRQETHCSDLADTAGDQEPAHTLLLEVGGNTDPWANAASSYVQDRLNATVMSNPEDPVAVRIVTEVDGKTAIPTEDCLRGPLLLSGSKANVDAFKNGTEDTKNEFRGHLERERRDEISVIADAVKREVQQTSLPQSPTLTPLPIWQQAASTENLVSILSPLVSTAGDCLQPNPGETPSAHDLVSDCVTAKDMPTIDGQRLDVGTYEFLAETSGQKAATQDMLVAMTTCGTPSGCR